MSAQKETLLQILATVAQIGEDDIFWNQAGDALIDTGTSVILVRTDATTSEANFDIDGWETGWEA